MLKHPLLSAPWFGPAIVAVAAWIGIVVAIDPAGSYPNMPEGPGLTVDEMFNVEQGVYLVEAIRGYGVGLLDPRSIREVFGQPPYLPDHPPLGRLWLGVHHHLIWAIAPPFDPENKRGTVTACARTGSATAFALTILLIGWFAGVNYGPLAGTFAAMFLTLMPRLWGHAHLASLETITNLMCMAAVLSAAWAWSGSGKLSWKAALIAGVFLGLAFLTKIQAILLPIPLAVWCLWRWRSRAIRPLAIWGVTAAVVFFIGWPWLWLDPIGHTREYFARTTARATLSVWYFGKHYADNAVPWHYPWVIATTTVSFATLAFGMTGGWSGRWRAVNGQPERAEDHQSLNWLLIANVLFPLLVFSIPKVAVYDCERLFLTVFPCWAVLAGRGGTMILQQFSRQRMGMILILGSVIIPVVQLVRFHPCELSFYNIFVGQTSGAERLGLETTYWGDSVTRTLLNDLTRKIPQGATVHFAPVLHQFQLDDLRRQSPILRQHEISLMPYEGMQPDVRYLLLYRRRADLPEELRFGPASGKLLAEVRRGGVQLAALYELNSDDDQ